MIPKQFCGVVVSYVDVPFIIFHCQASQFLKSLTSSTPD